MCSVHGIHARASVARSRGSPSELSGRIGERGKEKAKESSQWIHGLKER